MTNKTQIATYLAQYLELMPNEAPRTENFKGFLDRNGDDKMFIRSNFDGHITTSAFIIDATKSSILLIHHKSLNRWLQPGGHVEAGDATLLDSAYREAEEETQINREKLCHVPVADDEQVPFDIDSHFIPANPKKNELGHYHHDLRYLFIYQGDSEVNFNQEESLGLKWVAFKDLEEDATFGEMVKKIRTKLLNR